MCAEKNGKFPFSFDDGVDLVWGGAEVWKDHERDDRNMREGAGIRTGGSRNDLEYGGQEATGRRLTRPRRTRVREKYPTFSESFDEFPHQQVL